MPTLLTRNDSGFDSIAWAYEVHLKRPDPGIYNAAWLVGNEDAPDRIEFYRKASPLVTDKPYVWRPRARRLNRRRSRSNTPKKNIVLELRREYLDTGGYTRRGEYFGRGAPLYYWAFWNRETNEEDSGHIRAYSRADAKEQILSVLRSARGFQTTNRRRRNLSIRKYKRGRLSGYEAATGRAVKFFRARGKATRAKRRSRRKNPPYRAGMAVYNRKSWVLGSCVECGALNYVEPHGTTAYCYRQRKWTEHQNIPYEYRDMSGTRLVRRPPRSNRRRRTNPKYWTMARIREWHKGHFFSPGAMKFFTSKIYPTVYEGPGGVFFVTREVPPTGVPQFKVRRFNEATGTISTGEYARTLAEARTIAKAMARTGPTGRPPGLSNRRRNQDGARFGGSILDYIRAGDRVTIVNRFGQQSSGRAVMRGPAGWVLNMGGRHGTPAIAHNENIIKVTRARSRRNPGKEKRFLRRGRAHEARRAGFSSRLLRRGEFALSPKSVYRVRRSRERGRFQKAPGYSAKQRAMLGNPHTRVYRVRVPPSSIDPKGYDMTISAQSKRSALNEARKWCAQTYREQTGGPMSEYRLPRGTKVTEMYARAANPEWQYGPLGFLGTRSLSYRGEIERRRGGPRRSAGQQLAHLDRTARSEYGKGYRSLSESQRERVKELARAANRRRRTRSNAGYARRRRRVYR